MSSILTNNGAMVALQTLKSVNKSLSQVQGEISTGKSVANAKDNAAVWAISKVMESDVKGFKGISDSLSLGSSTIAVARQAAETVTDLLIEIKGKVVAAQESNVDRSKIQTDIDALVEQIGSVVGAAQFNGRNLVNGNGTTEILSSLDRSSTGVEASRISVQSVNLSTSGYTPKSVFAAPAVGSTAVASAAGDTFSLTLSSGGTDSVTIANAGTWDAGDNITLRLGDRSVSYTVRASDLSGGSTANDIIAVGLKNAIDAAGISGLTVGYDSGEPGVLTFANAAGGSDMTVTGQFRSAGSGALGALANLSVDGALPPSDAELASIEMMIQSAVGAAADFGSVQKQIDIQSEFVGKLTDSLRSGIGALVDANMEEASARLQALQVQQQLATQSLSIANQAPQSILSLFR